MESAVDAVTAAEGAVGALINNAGYSQSGAVETVPLDRSAASSRRTSSGCCGCLSWCCPGCATSGTGRSSTSARLGGRLTFPGGGIYHATKYAVEALSDALRFEVRGFGVDVILVEPGLIVTNFGEVAADSVGAARDEGPYGEFNRHVSKMTASAYKGPMAKLARHPRPLPTRSRVL